MFICTTCRVASGLSERLVKSEGPCEVCNTYDLCDDVPSSQIPANVKLVPSNIVPFTPVNQCCEDSAPPLSNTRTDGETFQCGVCDRWWAWDTDEASGSAWWPFDRPTERAWPNDPRI